jgi:hypothetical protein
MKLQVVCRTLEASRFVRRFFSGMPESQVKAAVNHMQKRGYDINALRLAIHNLARRGLVIRADEGLYQAVYYEFCDPYDIKLLS